MVWLIVAIGVLLLLLAGAAIYVRATKQGIRPPGYRFSSGFVIGMAVAAAIAIALSELGGYHSAMSYALPAGAALGCILGLLLRWRHQQ